MLKIFATLIFIFLTHSAFASWYMVRDLDGVVGVVGTYDNEQNCKNSLEELQKHYTPGNISKLSGKKFGKRYCASEWPK